jgi:hypothetical protein
VGVKREEDVEMGGESLSIESVDWCLILAPRARGGYTPRWDEKSAQDLENTGDRTPPLGKRVRKRLKRQGIDQKHVRTFGGWNVETLKRKRQIVLTRPGSSNQRQELKPRKRRGEGGAGAFGVGGVEPFDDAQDENSRLTIP